MSDPAGGGDRHPLACLFEPRSIAVVGASADPTKRGHQILRALGESGYRGRVYPVNPKGGSLHGHRVFPSIAAVPEPADLAVLCTPAPSAPDLVRACGERGIGGAVVLAVGFGESGPEGAELERRLVEAARATAIRLVGPNTSGLMNLHTGANLIGARDVRPGGLALLVQSGNMALTLMREATETTWEGISICVGVGNEADVGFGEALDYLGAQPDTRAVVVYAEGFRDARAFLDVASRVTRAKPVVLLKAGRSERGATSALSHTGAVAGPYDRLRAGLLQAGVVEVRRSDELVPVGHTLANQPAPRGDAAIAILSDGGGQGTLAVDVLTELEAPLATLSDDARARLRTLLGPAAAVGNPVDLAGAADADPHAFARALEILLDDDAVGAVLVVGLFGGYGIRFAEELTAPETEAALSMVANATRCSKGLVVHSMYAAHRSAPLEALGRGRVPVLGSLDAACRCVAELCAQRSRATRPDWWPLAPGTRTQSATTRALTEPAARALLTEHGVAFPSSVVARDAGEAAAAAEAIGRPVAMKVVSERIVHKAEAGGVALAVTGAEAARRAFLRIEEATELARAGDSEPEAVAVLVTPMADPPLAQLLVGAYRDPGLGPVLTVGAGGRWVEAVRDVSHRVLPVSDRDVRAMLGELRIAPLLTGRAGAGRADLDGVGRAALAVTTVMVERGDVEEVEINPLFVYEDRVVPIDARVIVLRGA